MNIYVGNLSFKAMENDLQQAFEAHGHVDSVSVIRDKESGQSRGFAFVEMPTKDEAAAAINALNGKDFLGRTLVVNEARPRAEKRDFRGGGDRMDYGDRRRAY